MESFRQCAYLTVACDAAFVALAATVLMIAFSFDPALALLIGANVALAFCLGLGLRARLLTETNVARTELWQALDRDERPVGEGVLRAARDILETALLRYARAAAFAAIVLSGSSLFLSLSMPATSDVVAGSGVHAMQGAAAR